MIPLFGTTIVPRALPLPVCPSQAKPTPSFAPFGRARSRGTVRRPQTAPSAEGFGQGMVVTGAPQGAFAAASARPAAAAVDRDVPAATAASSATPARCRATPAGVGEPVPVLGGPAAVAPPAPAATRAAAATSAPADLIPRTCPMAPRLLDGACQ